MGQDQSTVLSDERIGEEEARIRPRNKMVTTRQIKVVKRSAPDQFMEKADVIDHIKPIREADMAAKKELESYEGIMELSAQLKKEKRKEEEPLDLKVEIEEEPVTIFREAAHPVAIEGECAVNCTLQFRDDSPYMREFPVYKIEWAESLSVGEATVFSIAALAGGGPDTPLIIPSDSLGKYICVRAYRQVEDQFETTKLRDNEAGMYDAHVAGARTAKILAPKQFVTVVSTSIVGPVLLAEDVTVLILKALARGGFSCAVKLRDVLDSADRAVPLERDPVKAAKAKKKIPATLLVDFRMLELRYPKSCIRVDEDGLIHLNLTKEPMGTEFAVIEQPLDVISVRPSKGPNTIVLALVFNTHGYEHGGTQQLIRFDVDPAVGRDLALHQCLAFQAVRKARLTRSTLSSWYNCGNVEALRRAVQDFLEAQALASSEAAPAFEKMPTTPWSIMNYRA
ncbi:hypothetical protein cyc_02364 [Cyclospora cayetanensis]|uniref:Uncharacterized protein n=1 Tax=Cyclospora cayetanensis TaxID=88456 RepID=A0A1D3D8F5_9EIME|nr:hypothetical protein cyc_02364 [Cyclospora cayetanensis]